MPPKKSKEAIAKAAQSGGAKGKKKKWSKAKTKEKVNNYVLFDEELYKRILSEVPKQRLITPSNLSERFKLSGSLARKAIHHLHEKGLIRKVAECHSQLVYTRAIVAKEEEEKEKEAKEKDAKEAKDSKDSKDKETK
eukprot:CAMPEP_0171454426 /NCGR_PEP_ID=MMETSP0945-20130129/1713_1 /TAXON_ID=109269 /ORGANISM="Vaucheria litorea, Strain CCMP2940" /LENGTH=136 /DNA_ID=CAMNT_0011979439 /DNA_START=27 /DNA_END=437 /DNA_ORIENTATION=+